jgi:hypothetical protein
MVDQDRSTGHRGVAIIPGLVFFDDGTSSRTGYNLHDWPPGILDSAMETCAPHATIVVDGASIATHARYAQDVRERGWRFTEVGAWTLYHRADGRTVALGLRQAMATPHLGVLFNRNTPADVVARRLGQYARATGGSWRATPATSALAAIRDTWHARTQPLWRLSTVPTVRNAGALVWRRALTDAERAYGFVHTLDATSAYLGAAANANLGWSVVGHTGPQLFDPRLPGWWHLRLDNATLATLRDPLRPPVLHPRLVRDGCAWMTTPMVGLLAMIGDHCEVLDSYTGADTPAGPGQRPHPATGRTLYPWATRMRDGRPVRDPDGAVTHAWKRTYKDAVGGMQRRGMHIHRPDWGHTIVDLWRATLLTRIMRVHQALGVWPCEVKTDSLSYAHWDASPRDFAQVLDVADPHDPPRLGTFRHVIGLPTATWEHRPTRTLEATRV